MTQFHALTAAEVEGTKKAIKSLSSQGWAIPILANLDRAGGIKIETMPLLFEIRFAAALLRAGVVPPRRKRGEEPASAYPAGSAGAVSRGNARWPG
jgi:hypothetical protein